MDLLKKFEELDTSSIDERQKGALERFDQLGELLASTREEANRIKQGLQDDFRVNLYLYYIFHALLLCLTLTKITHSMLS